jgi:hypothetical protein
MIDSLLLLLGNWVLVDFDSYTPRINIIKGLYLHLLAAFTPSNSPPLERTMIR